MKVRQIILILIISAWPLFYLYERQLGAISFLLLAVFFLFISIKEMKKAKEEEQEKLKKQKIKQNSR
ncbi:hypothetical protein [Neobacillus thermocopriae]|uniref:Uncharacterized protein n=1 Tax=Neobacillus thermocopriae TaxID=1215031 RepID=A0A6B3TPE4_9BACI|nr:hypothetical protein [Neobacillus thermocopriae]MED3623838.1 hypothetical protein [Neobacillus thermocopriae]MED3713294.1 hypothetical protein [Neobacillus thermocopriae]NEX78266.1 hypothetical protein [Neobacillus thermocopriae]